MVGALQERLCTFSGPRNQEGKHEAGKKLLERMSQKKINHLPDSNSGAQLLKC